MDPDTPTVSLKEGQARLAGIIDSAVDAIIMLDSDQLIRVSHRAAERIFGCHAAEAVGDSFTRFLPEHLREDHRTFGDIDVISVRRPGVVSTGDLRGGPVCTRLFSWLSRSFVTYGISGMRIGDSI